jgi:hypothetical protein
MYLAPFPSRLSKRFPSCEARILKFLHKYSIENPGEEILSIQAFAGHGLIVNGLQVVAANNFNAKEEYYQFI